MKNFLLIRKRESAIDPPFPTHPGPVEKWEMSTKFFKTNLK